LDSPVPIITVLGMHRSGTSLCASVLQAMGVDMAEAAAPSPENQRGHWERPRINDLNESVFAVFGRGWRSAAHVLALPEHWLGDARVQAVRRELAAWIAPRLGGAFPFGFKDPRTSRLLPLWRQVFADLNVVPRFVYCVRDPAQVARSVAARDPFGRDQAEYRWLLYNAGGVAGVGDDPVCVVPYEAWFTDPVGVVCRLADFLGLPPLDARALASVVDGALRHDAAGVAPARKLAARLHQRLLDCAGEPRFSTDLCEFCGFVLEFEQLVQPLLVETEVLRASVADQNRVIGDLNGLVRQLRAAA
jgi:hypothetical protein